MHGVTLDARIRDLMAGRPATIPPSATLRDAAQMLATNWFGALIVLGREVEGILTERDLVQALAAGADIDDERVRDHLTADLETVEVDTGVRAAGEVMLRNEIRHLVVVDRGRPVGIVSIRDVLEAALAHSPAPLG